MQEDQTEEAGSHHCSTERCSGGDTLDPLDPYWEKLRVDG